MSQTATVRARISPEIKEEVVLIFKELGISVTEAINIFYRQVKLRQGLPFPVAIPTKLTTDTFEKTDNQEDLIICKDAEEMFDRLEI